MRFVCAPISASLLIAACGFAQVARAELHHKFETIVVSEEFHAEGACFGDIDSDGHADIVSGPYWYRGPDFRERVAYADTTPYSIKGYSEFFFTFADDFNGDGRIDILSVGMPGQPAYWFENQADKKRNIWKRRLAVRGVGNESPVFADLTGDGQKELVCIKDGAFGYASADRNKVDAEWEFVPVTDNLGFGPFTHGMGVGDVNGDGRADLLETNGWWEQTATPRELFRFHRHRFAQAGGAQMFAFDIDGDGDNDVVSTQNAHAYGLSWYEQTRQDGEPAFVEHPIMTDKWEQNSYGLAISQMHAVAAVDVDGDGVKDIITGKRYWAHGGNDPGAREANVLYWFRTIRPTGANSDVRFEPYLIDDRSGVGTQLTIGDVTGNGLADIVVGNKLGTFLSCHTAENVSAPEFERRRPGPRTSPAHVIGTSLFNENVRTTRPLSPEQQQRAFVLPKGFTIDLIAANPDIGQPMNLAFDGRGRLWVSSSIGYPFGAKDGEAGRDTIKIFEDTNGDGNFDKSTTFADDLDIPIGLLPYKNGVVCFSIPNIWYFEDTDGDDRADKRTVLYGPFDTSRDRHGMCNAFTRGLDGWIYACHGFNNTSTVTGADGHSITMRSGNIFRFRLDGSRIEHFTHGQVNPFGIVIDRFGDIFTADCHTKPINLLLRRGYHDSFGAPHDGLGYIPNVMEHLHGSTGIGGVALGEHTSFPDVYRDSTFGCNVVTSRVNRNSLVRTGASVAAREEPDFLTSSDPWFRPVYNIVGPDGSLYVADFYNAIIGHYEVDLHHPKRDRQLGRVWRVSFSSTDARRDPHSVSFASPIDLTRASLARLIRELDSENEMSARLAMDQITDRYPGASAELRDSLPDASGNKLLRLLWCLHRTGDIAAADIAKAYAASSAVMRVHATRLLDAFDGDNQAELSLLLRGLEDPEPIVRRAAVMASVTKQHQQLIRPLLELRSETPKSDVHLHHAIKMSLGHHLENKSWFRAIIADGISGEHQRTIAELCGFLQTDEAGRFLIRYVSQNSDIESQQLKIYLQVAARHIDEQSAAAIVTMIRDRFSNDASLQVELLDEMRKGLDSQSKPIPAPIRQLAIEIAERLFEVRSNETVSPSKWTAVSPSEADVGVRPWGVSTRRASADGMQNSPLWSSFTNGESLTGVFRSAPFTVPESISFYLAGHDGEPSKPLQGKNVVQLRDASTKAVLRSESPKRNDTAQYVEWMTSEFAGRRAVIDLVDGDSGAAYAWLAVGRFSIDELNPSLVPERRQRAATISRDFRLLELIELLASNLPIHANDPSTAKELAKALVSLSSDKERLSVRTALAEAMDFTAIDEPTRLQVAQALVEVSIPTGTLRSQLAQLLRVASSIEQTRIADVLCKDSTGATSLLDLVDQGAASARLLADPKRNGIIRKLLDDAGNETLDRLTVGVAENDEKIAEDIASRRSQYHSTNGSAVAGRVIFQKQCMTCHQVGNEGKPFAPNLDGIGSRGIDRLLEDVLDPHRNVDVAFRAQTIVTTDGHVFNGLVKDANEGQVRLIETTGVERLINKEAIEEQSLSNLSPMPSNFGEVLSDKEFRDLLAYLLSLVSS